jgi:Tfp pilus assembly protein PilV
MRHPKKISRAGMTVVEVLIASVLLAFVVLGSLAAISHSLALTNHARLVTISSQVLQSAVEDLRLRNYTTIAAYAAQSQPVNLTGTISSELLSSSFTATSGMTLQANFTTLRASGAGQLGLVAVEFTVTWTEQGAAFRRSARTYFGEKGLSDYIYVGF